jgi:hypothetical protein
MTATTPIATPFSAHTPVAVHGAVVCHRPAEMIPGNPNTNAGWTFR